MASASMFIPHCATFTISRERIRDGLCFYMLEFVFGIRGLVKWSSSTGSSKIWRLKLAVNYSCGDLKNDNKLKVPWPPFHASLQPGKHYAKFVTQLNLHGI